MIQMTNDKKNYRHKHMSIVKPQSDFLCQAVLTVVHMQLCIMR